MHINSNLECPVYDLVCIAPAIHLMLIDSQADSPEETLYVTWPAFWLLLRCKSTDSLSPAPKSNLGQLAPATCPSAGQYSAAYCREGQQSGGRQDAAGGGRR